jgi:hypothetical protein
MKSIPTIGGLAAALTTALILAGCSTPAPPPPPPPPAPPAPPPLSLSTGLLQSAAVYQAYVDKAAAISPDFKSGADVAQSLKFGDSYDPAQLLRGEIAFAAVAALQDPNFVANVRAFAVDPGSRQAVAASLLRDPRYVVAITGSDSAAGLVVAALMDRGQKMMIAGAAVKQAAYDIQHQDWSKQIVLDRDQRLADAKIGGGLMSSIDDVARLQSAVNGTTPLPVNAPPATPPYSPVVIRGLAVAALAALGEAGDENAELVAPLLDEPASTRCLNMAKLNLYQCLAVSRPHYEDVFCLGQHVLADTGQCLMIDAGAPVPTVEPLPVSKTETAYAPKPVSGKKRHKRT